MEKEITLIEALTGLDFVLTHLDGRKIRIANKPGEVIKPDSMFTVENMGMPFHKKSYTHGNLIIQFKIKFPNQVDSKMMGLLNEALGEDKSKSKKGGAGKKEEAKDDEVSETCTLKQFEEFHRNTHHQGGNEGNDSEEDEDDGHPHGQRVGCQTQ